MKQVGDILKAMPQVAPVKRRSAKIIVDAAVTIAADPQAVELAYMARQLVVCTLPHRDPGKVPVWVRRNGRATLGLVPGMDIDTGESYGYPYGILPRLVLFWISTEVVKKKQRRLELGKSLAHFMRELGLNSDNRGKRSDAYRLRAQMHRLFRCRISFQQSAEAEDGSVGMRWKDMDVAPEGELWWHPHQPLQDTLWGSWIELGERFYEAVLAAPVPVDMRALKALKNSPLALDLYAFLTHRVFRLKQTQFVPWVALQGQIGTDYTVVDEFARHAKAALKKVKLVYPGLRLRFSKGGFYLSPSLTAVPEKAKATASLTD
jgi:hypothetical protein